MKTRKSSEQFNQNTLSQKGYRVLSEQDQNAITAFFVLLLEMEMEIDQKNNVTKECVDAKQVK